MSGEESDDGVDEVLGRILKNPDAMREFKHRLDEMRESMLEWMRLQGFDEAEVIEKADRVLLEKVNELKLILTRHAEKTELWLEQAPHLFTDEDDSDSFEDDVLDG